MVTDETDEKDYHMIKSRDQPYKNYLHYQLTPTWKQLPELSRIQNCNHSNWAFIIMQSQERNSKRIRRQQI